MKKLISSALAAIMIAVASVAPCVAAPSSGLESAILAGVRAGQTDIDISNCNATVEEAVNAFKHLYLVEPDMYPVSNHINCQYKGTTATSVKVQYAVDKNARARYDSALAAAVAVVGKESTQYDKAKAAHDYLLKNVKAGQSGFSSYAALVEGSSVCSGYSLAFKAIMNKVGIDCEIAVSQGMNHEWAMVKIDGAWYHCDILWDKNTSDANGGAPCYDNFLKSDTMIGLLGHTGWVTTGKLTATSTKYDLPAA